ncbi:MAG TPA: hypothetical protein P5048_00720, partial [Chlamydiales bacterium]|nr:hypothetical protein [Chlamydiales bacterium]
SRSKIEQIKQEVYEKQNIGIRFNHIFSNLNSSPSIKKEEGITLFNSPILTKKFIDDNSTCLFFFYHNGIDPDFRFSGQVISKLFIDKKKNLCLITWPIDNLTIYRKEILYTEVTEVSSYFYAYTKGKFEWLKTWPPKDQKIPFFAKLVINTKASQIPFSFFIPSSEIIPYIEEDAS